MKNLRQAAIIGVIGVPTLFSFPSILSAQDSTSALSNSMSRLTTTRLLRRDTDRDGLPDIIEKKLGTNPILPDSNGNKVWDGEEAFGSTGITNLKALQHGLLRLEDGLDDEDEIGDGDDGESGSASTLQSGSKKAVSHPPKRPVVTCRKPNQRNCTLPACRKPKQKNCRPTATKPPAGKPPTSVPPTVKPPTANPTPAPTGNFDANGNTTHFGIPSGMTGNVSRGGSIWTSFCSGCHGGEKTNHSFGQLRASFSIPAMAGIRLSDSQLADLTAYLNRSQR